MSEATEAEFKVEILRLWLARDLSLSIARRHGGSDGAHHKAWVIDQMVRALTGAGYAAFVAEAKAGEDGPDTYAWDEGIAP